MAAKTELTQEEMFLYAASQSCVSWLDLNKINLGHSIWSLKGHIYQHGILECDHPQQVAIKGAQMGLAIDINEPVPTSDGFKCMGDMEVGDAVFGSQGQICNVTAVSPIRYEQDCYQVIFSDGTKIVADGEHKWRVRNVKYNSYHTLTTARIYPKVRYRSGARARYAVDVVRPIVLPEKDLFVDPYLLGLWLGDGAVAHGHITARDVDATEYAKILEKRGYSCHFYTPKDEKLKHIREISIKKRGVTLISQIKQLGLWDADSDKVYKRVPEEYLRASYAQRLELLRGLIDSDGHIEKSGGAFFYNTNEALIRDVCGLIKSLGWKAYSYDEGLIEKGYGGKERQSPPTTRWEIYFRPDDRIRVANLRRKYIRQTPIRRPKETNSRYIIDILPVPSVPVRCIVVDSPDHLFCVSESFILTHNSEIWVLKTLHGLIYGHYLKGALYLFPTRDDVSDFSKARFDPLIANNSCIGAYVRDTDAKNIKKVGNAFLYLRGARVTKTVGGTKKSSSQLKTVPVDRIVFDERDEMDDAMVELALERISHSSVQEEMHLGTPTIPDFGVDKIYQESDQRVWMLKCKKCGTETCLELEFPDCILERPDGTAFRACRKCQEEIYPRDGNWVSRYENRDFVGWWISQLNSIYVRPEKILNLFRDPPNGNLAEVYNSKLGMAYIAAENRLTKNDVWACCSKDPMAVNSEDPTAMGVDVGKNLTVVIGSRPNRSLKKILKVIEVESFDDVHDLAAKFNVQSAVIDMYPETRAARQFQKSEDYQVFLCEYKEHQGREAAWDEANGSIAVNRTEICDASHELVTSPGMLEIPRRSDAVEEYVTQMTKMAKILQEDTDTGSNEYRYKKLGPDHYRHATNYFLLASERVSISSDKKIIRRFFNRRKGRTWMTA